MAITISTPVVGNPVGAASVQDANYQSSVTLSGGATVNSTAFDMVNSSTLNSDNGALAYIGLQVSLSGTIVTTGTATATVYHSADNSTFVAVPELGAVTFSAANGNINTVNGANRDVWSFPAALNRYVKVTIACSSAGLTSGTATVALVF